MITSRNIKNAATGLEYQANKSSTRRATSKRAGTDGKEQGVVPYKKCKASIRDKRRNTPATTTSKRNNNSTHDGVEVLKKEANMATEVSDKKIDDVKLGLLDVKMKRKEKSRARRKRKQKLNWSNMQFHDKAKKDDINEIIDSSYKNPTSMQEFFYKIAGYSSTNETVKVVKSDAKNNPFFFKKKSGAVRLKNKEENKAMSNQKLPQNQSSIKSNKKVITDEREKKIVLVEKQKADRAAPCKTTDLDIHVRKVTKEDELEMNDICGKKSNAVNPKPEEMKQKNKAKNKARRKKKRDLAKKLETSIKTNDIHDETAPTYITDTKDDLEEAKQIKEIGGENIYLKNLMLVKRDNKKARRKIQQQKKAAKSFVGIKSNKLEEDVFTKRKIYDRDGTKSKRSEGVIEKSKKRHRG